MIFNVITYSGGTRAFLDSKLLSSPTIRSSDCEVLIESTQSTGRCISCTKHRRTLNATLWRATHSSTDKSDPGSHTNIRYMSSPEKSKRMERLQKSVRVSQQQVARIKATLSVMAETRGTVVDQDLHEDLCTTMDQNTQDVIRLYPEGSFQRFVIKS